MQGTRAEECQLLVEQIRASSRSAFYRDRWGSETEFEKLPSISRTDILSTPLSERSYKSEKSFIKIVRSSAGYFTSEWSFADSAREDWGEIGKRPLVYLNDPDEALEKTLWCYERDALPLIAESIPEITFSAADFFHIDSMIADARSLSELRTYLAKRHEPLTHLTILGTSFDYTELFPYTACARMVSLVLTLPETGAIARAVFHPSLTFTPVSNCHIERSDRVLVTKMSMLTTPVVKYELPRETARHLALN